MGRYFGTDGIRGRAGTPPLDVATIERIGQSLTHVLSTRLNRPPRLVIGRDTRESGEWIEAAITRGIRSLNGETLSAGVITTPGVAYLTRALEADAGVVLSASHNPFEDNGIKVFSASGQKLDEEAELAIEQDLNGEGKKFPAIFDSEQAPRTDPRLVEKYLDFLQHEIAYELDLRRLRIVLDCANGAASQIAPRLFGALGADLTVIHANPNGRNINLDCGSLHTGHLQAKVLETRANLGIAFDGDADRLVMIDERGREVDGDQVLFIMAEYLSSLGKLQGNRVVATVMSNLGLELGLKERGIHLVRTSVGDKNVLEELVNGGGSIGGEQSGHIIFPEISLAGDGILSALEVLRVMAESEKSLSDLAAGFIRYPQITINVRVQQKPPIDSVPSIRNAVAAIEHELDGAGRLLLRYSGTENLARVMIEGKDESVIRYQAESLAAVIRNELGA
jgi:phosphoglucosamine mutase